MLTRQGNFVKNADKANYVLLTKRFCKLKADDMLTRQFERVKFADETNQNKFAGHFNV